ncbi:caspase domain-containing protein [Russula dissimulans]|nr:caspase domain-containing protein [Russula dissimulans]
MSVHFPTQSEYDTAQYHPDGAQWPGYPDDTQWPGHPDDAQSQSHPDNAQWQPEHDVAHPVSFAPTQHPASGSGHRSPPMSNLKTSTSRKDRHWSPHPLFRHSRCTGRRKALCVGINYTGQQNPLSGCVNDANDIHQFLIEQYRYPHSNIILLTDDNPDPHSKPTRENLLNSMRWLVEDSHADDALFVHYSGHGGRVRDMHGDALDGFDDVIFPLDYKTTGIITDDILHNTLVKPLPAGCRLTAVFDSCHSGSILDLLCEFHSDGQLKSCPVSPAFRQSRDTPADVICISGCKDSQTSADITQGGTAVGAMSYALLRVLKSNPQITYIDLLRGVRQLLKKYNQKPQLSASHKVNRSLFISGFLVADLT